ncbi:unnamed protein product [Lathyrus sativus]|nr:unnamed protein product [Lathyrus sativus]
MANRLGKVLISIIHSSQDAFVPGKNIHDHILIAYELIRGYSATNGATKCMLQMDLQKAYDTVEWIALENILKELNFPQKFINWIMITIKAVSYKFQLNDSYTQLVDANRGFRQGGHLSPLLFVTVMKYFDRLLQKLKGKPNLNYHSKCEKMDIINFSFADDLQLFARGDSQYVEMLMVVYEEFSKSTYLRINPTK